MKYKIKVNELELNDVESIIDGAMYGCAYWCDNIKINYKNTTKEDYSECKCASDRFAKALLKEEYLIFTDIEDHNQKWYLNYKRLCYGVERFIEEGRCSEINEIFTGNEDISDMDIIVQYAMFDEITFA